MNVTQKENRPLFRLNIMDEAFVLKIKQACSKDKYLP